MNNSESDNGGDNREGEPDRGSNIPIPIPLSSIVVERIVSWEWGVTLP